MASSNSHSLSAFKAGQWQKQYGYKSFLPVEVNQPWRLDSDEIIQLLSEADRKLGELNAFGMLVPDVDFFIVMHITKEATLSSRIEGTQTHIGEALMSESDIDPEKRNDWGEVQNYILAINSAIDELKKLPLSNRLLKQTHRQLMQGVRGKHKQPGEFRTSQNWIGGASLADAVFIPPHHEQLANLMADLEKFLHNTDLKIPHLIKIAIAHYQFETIHPFLDGNGRLGRLLITLYLVSNQVLHKPSLYLSHFFEKNKALYYDNLMTVRTRNDMEQWLKFFLVGVKETAENSIVTFKKILQLKEEIETRKITTLGKKTALAQQFIRILYKRPMVHAAEVATLLQINIVTANRLINDFVQLNILVELTGFKRNRLFSFKSYIQIFEE